MNQRRLGIVYALAAYGSWGLLPLYLHAMRRVPPLELLAHRIVWSFVLLAAVLLVRREFAWLGRLRREPRILWSFIASSIALSINWFVYIWSVEAGRVVDASLGYFMNPLVSVVLAVIVLKERLRAPQWLAIASAALGVLWLTALAGQVPWIGLGLALSFGSYGLLRKTAALEALAGLALETTLLLPFAAGLLLVKAVNGTGVWGLAEPSQRLLLLAAGPLTALPLVSFAAGARRIPLSLAGILQYLAPTLQLLLGVWAFGEPLDKTKLVGFALIWLSVALYSLEGLQFARSRAAPQAEV